MLPLQRQQQRRERLAGQGTGGAVTAAPHLGIWLDVPASAQCPGQGLEPQTRLSGLLPTSTEPAHQTAPAYRARAPSKAANTPESRCGVVDGLHARPAQRWAQLQEFERD